MCSTCKYGFCFYSQKYRMEFEGRERVGYRFFTGFLPIYCEKIAYGQVDRGLTGRIKHPD